MTAYAEYPRIGRKLAGPPLTVAELRRLLRFDTEANTLVWVRRKEPVIVDKTGNVLVRGHHIPAYFLTDAVRDGEFPEWGSPMSSGISKQGGRYMVMVYYGDKTLFGGMFSLLDEARITHKELTAYLDAVLADEKRKPKAIAALTGARKDNRTGYRGVSYLPNRKKYIGRVTIDLKTYSVGSFDTAQDAYAAVIAEEARVK